MQAVAIRTGVLVGLAAIAAAALWFSAGRGLGSDEPAQAGLRFDVSCDGLGSGGDLAGVTCSVTVKGLPDPLEREVTVRVAEFAGDSSSPGEGPVGDTVVASEAPSLDFGLPALVLRQDEGTPPSPSDLVPEVPQQPPRVA